MQTALVRGTLCQNCQTNRYFVPRKMSASGWGLKTSLFTRQEGCREGATRESTSTVLVSDSLVWGAKHPIAIKALKSEKNVKSERAK